MRQIHVSFPWILAFIEERWGSLDTPPNAFSAAAEIVLSAAARADANPHCLAEFTGFPATYIWATLDTFQNHPDWRSYVTELNLLLAQEPLDAEDLINLMVEAMEDLWGSDTSIDLEKLWFRLTGFADDEELAEQFSGDLSQL
jgi:hypothetical protein